VILKSLQKSPADRYQSADEMHASLLRLRGEARGHQRSVAGNTSIEVALRRMKSIAVMPVRALTTDAAGDMLADGTTDALIAGLGKLTGLRVVSLTSVMGYKGVSMRLPELAGELGVDGVVEGCLVVTGGRARVTARLFHAAHERCVWSRMYEGGRRDILALQSELAEALAQQVWVVTAPRRAAGRSRSRRTGCGRDRLASMRQSPDDRRRLPTDAGAA
jgi:TolB-like protein